MKRARERKPSVVVFEEPGKRQRKEPVKRQKPSPEKADDEVNFKQIAREVREFGMSGFTKRKQRKYQQQQAQSLGAKAPKKQKMPYPLLMRVKKIRDEREAEQKQMGMAMGTFKKKAKKSQKPNSAFPKGFGRWVDRSKGLESGKFKNGVHKVRRKDIAKFQKKTKQ